MNKRTAFLSVLIVLLFFVTSFAAEPELETKVQELETRIATLEKYIDQLHSNLESYSKEVLDQIDIKVKSGTDKVVAISPVSKKMTKIETNAGMFLVAVNKLQRTEDGYRLLLNVGNPNLGKFSGLKFKLSWGKDFDPTSANVKYEDWRKSLLSGEYTYPGALL